ncbi:MAG: DNA methyltransferase [Deltaproteobacteria bacterium]|nr:DNA methyltransferase [Deltaproteobacteria bacterium]
MLPNWANRTLWTGDNLDIMRGMNSASVDLIYLDPPFNSNRDYAAPIGSEAAGAKFKDTWTLSDVDEAWHGEIADRDPTLYAIIDAAGLSHGKGMKSYLIMMAVRLLEMRRILRPTGALFLHCDPTADAYLRMLCDAIFDARNFRNQIVWKRTSAAARGVRKVAAIHDVILFYGATSAMETRQVYTPHDPKYVSRFYRLEDEHGRYQAIDLTAAGERYGDSGEPWRGIDPTAKGRHWAGPGGGFPAHISKPENWDSMTTRAKLDSLDELGLIIWPKRGGGGAALQAVLEHVIGPTNDGYDSRRAAALTRRQGACRLPDAEAACPVGAHHHSQQRQWAGGA